jgi:surface polysaccharide O-acyltransferase-like enzyme
MQRLAWIDNLRVTVIILVVILHTAVTYSGLGGWYYKENEEVDRYAMLFFAFFQTFTQAFFMSLLFMVSGYFTQRSIIRKGTGKFTKGRLFRLGIPLLIYIFIIQLVAVRLAFPDIEIFEWYLNGIKNLHFLGWTGPLWFVEALLIFTLLYVLVFKLFIRRDFKIKLKISTLNVVLLITAITIVAFALRLVYPIGTDFYNLQFGFFSAYIMMFAVGILAYASALFEQITFRDGKKWLLVSLGLGIPAWIAIMFFGGPSDGNMLFEGGMNWPAFFYALWESFFCVTFIIALVGLYKYRLNISGKLQKFLSDNAFGVFVFHAPVLIGISMLLKDLVMHPVAKFFLVATIAVPLTFFVSWLVRRVPLFSKIFS